MLKLTPEDGMRITVENSAPLVIQAETGRDDILIALADGKRRTAIAVIRDGSTPMDVSTLAERVASELTPESADALADGTVRQLQTALYHQHLPMMASAGLIAYDSENQTVETTDALYS